MSVTSDSLTVDQIMVHFSTDEAARRYLEAVRWPNGPVCPHCSKAHSERIYDIAANPAKKIRSGLRECKECGGSFTVTVGTIFEDSKVPLRKWLVAWYMLCTSKKGISVLQIQRMLELGSYRTAQFMMHRIRYALRDPVFADKFARDGGVVAAAEAYVGGSTKGKGRAYKGNKTPLRDNDDDERDAEIARRRLEELKKSRDRLVEGEELHERLARIET